MSCGVGLRRSLDLALLWLWCRPSAVALIRPLAWEPPYAVGMALKRTKRQKKKKWEDWSWARCMWGWVSALTRSPVSHVPFTALGTCFLLPQSMSLHRCTFSRPSSEREREMGGLFRYMSPLFCWSNHYKASCNLKFFPLFCFVIICNF